MYINCREVLSSEDSKGYLKLLVEMVSTEDSRVCQTHISVCRGARGVFHKDVRTSSSYVQFLRTNATRDARGNAVQRKATRA